MLINLKYDSKSVFLPEIKIPIFISMFDIQKTRALHRFIMEKEKWILENVEPYPADDDKSWLTNRLYGYNFFNFSDECKEINELKQFLLLSYEAYCESVNVPIEKCYIQCWANILRNNGRGITEHTHADGHADSPYEYAYVSGTICLTNLNTYTSLRNPFLDKHFQDIKNHAGENILFPSWVIHKTDVNTAPIPRVSIAYDIITEEQYNLASVAERKSNFIPLN
jgi:hypothetical protein